MEGEEREKGRHVIITSEVKIRQLWFLGRASQEVGWGVSIRERTVHTKKKRIRKVFYTSATYNVHVQVNIFSGKSLLLAWKFLFLPLDLPCIGFFLIISDLNLNQKDQVFLRKAKLPEYVFLLRLKTFLFTV